MAFLKEHVYYEISMLHYSFGQIKTEPDNQYMTNIILESFVLHSRNLIDFFLLNKKVKIDDVIALDYHTKSRTWFKIVEKHQTFLKMIKHRADKELAHMTLKRKYGILDEKSWDYETIYSVLKEIINQFINDLEDDAVKFLFQKAFTKIGFSR